MSRALYSTVPKNTIINAEHKRKIRRVLESHPGSYFKARSLAILSQLPTHDTQVRVRRAITELIEVEHCPIVSGPGGFCWADTEEVIGEYLSSLDARIEGIQARKRAVYRSWYGTGEKTANPAVHK